MDAPRLVREQDLADAGQTSGMTRRTAFQDDEMWIGTARTEPGAVSGWHHHGDHTSYIYCEAGAIRIESGTGGRDAIEAQPGEFIVIPQRCVHRESNPTDIEQRIVVTRIGSGPVLTNVDGPDPAT